MPIIKSSEIKIFIVTVLSLFSCVISSYAKGPAFSGLTATANDATTALLNPAGLTRLTKTEIVMDTLFAYSDSDFKMKSESTAKSGTIENDPGFMAVPTFYLSKPINEKLWFGFSLSVPLGIGSDYGDDWAGRYIVQESSMVFISATPVLAYRINEWFSIGGGFSLVYANAYQKSAVNNIPEDLPDGEVEYDSDGWGISGNIGFLLECSPQTRFGITYRTEAKPELEAEPELKDIGPLKMAVLELAGVLGEKVNADLVLPRAVTAGAYHEFTDKLSCTADIMWIDFDQFGAEEISVGDHSTSYSSEYEDMWGGSIGLSYLISDKWETSVGAMYLSEGVNDENRTLSLPLDRIIGYGVGAKRWFNDNHALQTNLEFYDTGSKKIYSEPNESTGLVVGEYDTPYSYVIDVSYQWRF